MIKTFISIINKIRQLINILIALPFLVLFYIYVNRGYSNYIDSNSVDDTRIKFTDIYWNYIFTMMNWTINYQIVYIGDSKIDLEKVTIVNGNHTHSNDLFILFNLFNHNKLKGHQVTSISTINGIGEFDKKVLIQANSALVNGSKDDINNIIDSFKLWNLRKYNSAVIIFFEGIAKNDSKEQSKTLKHLLDPKTLGFALTAKYSKSKYMYDLNLIYTHQGKLMDSKDPNFTWLLFHPDTKIYVDLHKYELPTYEKATKWIKDLYKIKDQQIDNIIKKYDIKLDQC